MILVLISPRNAGLPFAQWLPEQRGRLVAVTEAGAAVGEGFAEVVTVSDYSDDDAVLDAARRRDDGQSVATEAACCKYYASEMVGRVADRAVQIHGGAGYVADYGIERFYRDVRLFRIYEGTSQIQQIVIARGMLREQAGA